MFCRGHILQWVVMAMLGVAVVMVNSASLTVDADRTGLMSILTSRYSLHAVLAIAAMGVASRFDIHRVLRYHGWANPLLWALALSVTLLILTQVPGLGRSANGASRWLYIPPRRLGVTFQPSELAKWVMVPVIAAWCVRRSGVMHRFSLGLGPALGLVGLVGGLIVIEDLGTGLLVGLVAVVMLVAGGARLWQMMLALPVAGMAMAAAILQSPYRLARLTAFMNPWADPQGSGYHPIQSMLAIAQGGLTGRGLGNGLQKFGYLPEDTTDFVFAIICEEVGIAGAALVVGLYLLLIWVGLGLVRQCRDPFGRLFALGVLVTVGLQGLMNLAVVTVLVPTKGIALPLISAGGTGWVLTASAIGLVAAMDKQTQPRVTVSCDQHVPRSTPAAPMTV